MATRTRIRVIQFGLGAIGLATARLVQSKKCLELAGAVEADLSKASKSQLGVPVASTLRELMSQVDADVVLHTTRSHGPVVIPQLMEVVNAGLPCVSSAEELFFPIGSNRRAARQLDAAARCRGVAVLGTGVNPGFVMDLLPVILSFTCQRIDRILIRRIVDVSTRRIQLQQKVGVGMSQAEFRRRQAQGSMGHVGLRESARFVASALGWRLDSMSDTIVPVVRGSRVMGIRQCIRGGRSGREVLALDLEMSADAVRPRDEIVITGEPPVHLVIPGGVRGDQATAAILVNSVALVRQARPGLRSALELGVPRMLS